MVVGETSVLALFMLLAAVSTLADAQVTVFVPVTL